MHVLSTTVTSRPGNDVYIEESYSLVEQFGLYSVIQFYKVRGWSEREEVNVLIATTDKAAAAKEYKKYCKFYRA